MSSSNTATTVIRIHYEPQAGATLGVRCGESGGDGNDWQKFYYATKKADAWVCSIPGGKEGTQLEFKPVLQYNASTPPLSHSIFNFSSPNLRKSFLNSSSSALFRSGSQADFGGLINSPSMPKKDFQQEEIPSSPLRNEGSGFLSSVRKAAHLRKGSMMVPSRKGSMGQNLPPQMRKGSMPVKKDAMSPMRRELSQMMSPLRPSVFSVEGEKDESYAVGANYLTFAGRTIDVYPWFYNWQGSLETIEDVDSKIS